MHAHRPTHPLHPPAPPVQVLYDLGVVSTPEPFQRLVSQGMILGEVEYTLYRDAQGSYVPEGTHGAEAIRWGWVGRVLKSQGL